MNIQFRDLQTEVLPNMTDSELNEYRKEAVEYINNKVVPGAKVKTWYGRDFDDEVVKVNRKRKNKNLINTVTIRSKGGFTSKIKPMSLIIENDPIFGELTIDDHLYPIALELWGRTLQKHYKKEVTE